MLCCAHATCPCVRLQCVLICHASAAPATAAHVGTSLTPHLLLASPRSHHIKYAEGMAGSTSGELKMQMEELGALVRQPGL